MTRVGLIGCGRWGSRWLNELHEAWVEGLTSAPLVYRRKPTVDGWYMGTPAVSSLPKFFDAVTHVVVASPTETHAMYTREALDAGKSVLSEKPLSTTLGSVEQLFERASRLGVGRLWVSYPHLWHPFVESIAWRAKREGNADLECVFMGETPREPLLDWAPHALTAALYIIGENAGLKACAVSKDGKRAQLELVSNVGRARVDFGESPVKKTRVKLNTPVRRMYNGEPTDPTTLQAMLRSWLRGESDARGEPALTIGTHRILEGLR